MTVTRVDEIAIICAGLPSDLMDKAVYVTTAERIVRDYTVEEVTEALVRNAQAYERCPAETPYHRVREHSRRSRKCMLMALQAACVKRHQEAQETWGCDDERSEWE